MHLPGEWAIDNCPRLLCPVVHAKYLRIAKVSGNVETRLGTCNKTATPELAPSQSPHLRRVKQTSSAKKIILSEKEPKRGV